MAEYNLTNNAGTFTLQKQNNLIEIKANKTYVESDISITTKVVKAVLNSTADQNQFQIQIPNGNSPDITLTFTVDTNGNVLVT